MPPSAPEHDDSTMPGQTLATVAEVLYLANLLLLPGLLCDELVWKEQADALGDIADATIGFDPVAGTENLDGLVDELRVYSRALSQSEVFELVNETRTCGGGGGKD